MRHLALTLFVSTWVVFSLAHAKPARPLHDPAPTSKPQISREPRWSSYGTLRETHIQLENGQPLYVLVTDDGALEVYVSSPRGKSLKSYTNRLIAVYGPLAHSVTPKVDYLEATHIAVP